MTAVAGSQMKEPRTMPDAPPMKAAYLSADQLLAPRTFKTTAVEIPGRGAVLVREFSQSEREDLDAQLTATTVDAETGKLVFAGSERGYKVRACVMASVGPDGVAPLFADVARAIELIGKAYTKTEIDVWFKAVDDLNALTRGAQDAAVKPSGKAPNSGGGPN